MGPAMSLSSWKRRGFGTYGDKFIRADPDKDWCNGFFVAVLEKSVDDLDNYGTVFEKKKNHIKINLKVKDEPIKEISVLEEEVISVTKKKKKKVKDDNQNTDCISTQIKTYLENEKEDLQKSKKKKKKKDKESIENYDEGISNVTTTHLEDKEHSNKKKKKKKKDKENIPIEDDGISNIIEGIVYEKPKKKKKKKDKAKVQDLSEFISTSNNKLETDEQLNGTSIK